MECLCANNKHIYVYENNLFFFKKLKFDELIIQKNVRFYGCAEERPPQSGFFNDTKIERN